MKINKINPYRLDSKILTEAARILSSSGVIAHATETVYGLAAKWNDWNAIQKLTSIKKRSLQQPYSIMVNSIEQIVELAGWESPHLSQLLEAIFPGPVSLLIPHKREFELPYWKQFSEIGIRFPDHNISRELVLSTQSPLITTSANISGDAPPKSCPEISTLILDEVSCVLDSGPCLLKIPSTIIKVDFDKRKFTIIRQGAFSTDKFSQIFYSIF